jgi:hypothetical protein
MPTTLDGRLLCASVSAYGIQKDGSFTAQPDYDRAAGWLKAPVSFVGGPDNINACLVGATADGVVVAFRGTLPPSSPYRLETLLDWLNNFDGALVQTGNLPGRVHDGFRKALDTLWAPLLAEVQRLRAAAPGSNTFVTGHSKGGAMADLAAMRLELENGIHTRVVTFAAPHPGDQAFAEGCIGRIDVTRYEYADDIVPHVPPGLAFRRAFAAGPLQRLVRDRPDPNYAPVGTLRYIRRDGTIVGDSPTLEAERFLSLTKQVAGGRVAEIAKDHDSRCGGGYMSALCPSGVCS